MKISVLIPVLNEAARLPALFRALPPALRGVDAELLFIDNGSTDNSRALVQAFSKKFPAARLLEEPAQGFPEPLNRGLVEAKGECALFLDADALPAAGWAKAMVKALGSADIAVGETLSILPPKPTAYGKLAGALFRDHSRRAASAVGHALPWGPACNLGVHVSWFAKVGPFSSAATSAFDIDWCWRAVLAGARISYCPQAKIKHWRRNDRMALLSQFDRYGRGEAWLHRTYSFLLGEEAAFEDPLSSGVDAFLRLRHRSRAAALKSLGGALDEVATAFASGVRLGYELPHRPCALPRPVPSRAVGWPSGKGETTVFVPGKGVTTLAGEGAKIWEAWQGGAEPAELERLFARLHRCSIEEAHHGIHEFLEALSP